MLILEKYRKYGIGSKLMNQFKEYYFFHNIEELKGTASSKNSTAIEVYKKMVFMNLK